MSEPSPAVDRVDQETVALAAVAGGAGALVIGWIIGSRLLRIVGLGAAAAGGVFYARLKLAERSEKIEAAENDVRAALEDLDPVARAQVLADAAKSQLH
ncbi:MAG TPA: hypothetical protein VLK36_06670 [Gaiellaceae bacterium]|nr:hypothetical protein [Gaiellaceae bacterium]